jgi:hypothetical protein
MIKAHQLKIGDSIAGTGDDGEFLGTIQRFEVGNSRKNGDYLNVVTETGTYKAIFVCACPSEAEIKILCKEARERHFEWKQEQWWTGKRLERECGIKECKLR